MRSLCMTAIAATCCLSPAFAPAVFAADPPGVVSGRVFLDANANGQMDGSEKGLPGIRITDSVDFVTTGADGSYRITLGADPIIPCRAAQVVSVSWPGGWWPTGPWWARLDQIADADHVDFGLREDKQSLPFAFVHVSDDHGAGYDHTLIPRLTELGSTVKFCFNTGDMGGAGMPASIAAMGKRFPVPMFFAIGNHDCAKDVPLESGPLAGVGAFTKHLGPIRWSFDYADVHFTAIDWWDPFIKEHVEGSAPPAAAEWLEKDLKDVKPGTRIILLIHFPSGCPQFYEVIAKHKVSQAFGGHNHRHEFYNVAGVAAVTTVNQEASGSGNLCVVTKDAIDVIFYCNGGKHGPTYHGKRCGLSSAWRSETGAVAVPAERPDKSRSVTNVTLDSATKSVDAGPSQGVSITAEFVPGTAKRTGLRLGAGEPIEIAFTGRTLDAAGAPVPFVLLPTDAGVVRLQVIIVDGVMTFEANNRIRMARPKSVRAENPAAVTLFAEGGKAEFKNVSVTGLK